jgi:hypothetical protein
MVRGTIRGFGASVRLLVCTVALLSWVAPAAAQEALPAESPPAQTGAMARPPDIVKLKNGGLIRGTISELIPDDAVVILMVTGETRRIPMAEVEYAGPDKPVAPEAPAPKPAAAPAEPEPETPSTLNARLESVDVPIKFFARSETEGVKEFSELCTAPCDAALTPGNYRFALSEPDAKEPLTAMPTLRITGPVTVRGKFRSRRGLRAAGGVTLFLGTIVGVLLWATASDSENVCTASGSCVDVDVENEARLWAGRLITGGSIITGFILLTRGDSATVEVVPGAPSAFREPGRFSAARDRGPLPSAASSGLSLVGHF